MELYKVMVLFLFQKEVLCYLNLGIMSSKHILPNTLSKDFTYDAYNSYLDDFLSKDNVPKNLTLSFPSSLTSSNYTLTEGKVDRYYDPLTFYGSLNKVLFHQLQKEFYGISHVYGPKIDFSFRYKTTHLGSPQSGSLSMIVSHEPVELQMDLGKKEGSACKVDRQDNDVFYFYNDNLKIVQKHKPDEGSSKDAAEALSKHLTETWAGKLYKIMMKVKFEKLISDVKDNLLKGKHTDSIKHICQTIL